MTQGDAAVPVRPRRPSRRSVLKGIGVVGGTAAAASVLVPEAASARPAVREPAARKAAPTAVTISSAALQVTLDPGFPAVLDYTWLATGAVMVGQPGGAGRVTTMRVNSTVYQPSVTVKASSDHAVYQLTSGGFSASVTISVSGTTVTWAVTALKNGHGTVGTFGVPGLQLLSAGSDEGGQFADLLLISQYSAPQTEQFRSVASLTADGRTYPATYGVLNTTTLAGAVYTTIIGDQRLAYSTATDPNDTTAQRTGLGPGSWIVTTPDGTPVGLPSASVAITADANGDGVVDWQDGAIALRSLYQPPYGAARVRSQVVQGNVENFGSTADQPFLTTLDEIKRCYLITDGLPQVLLLKGYQSEGHDTAHPDYAGHYNTRAGGLTDLRTLIQHATRYNADVGVHINDVVNYPESHAFRWDRTPYGDSRGRTTWLDQSWILDTSTDLTSGMFASRIDALLADVPDLPYIYSDAFRIGGIPSWQQARVINGRHLPIWTEYNPFGEAFSPTTYTGGKGTGFTSKLLRFVANSYRDAWASDPLLLGMTNVSYQGWSSENDMSTWLAATYTVNLPTKYMQHQQILTMGTNRVTFTGNLVADNTVGHLQLFQDGALVLDGTTVFLPWTPGVPDRVYHWNDAGGTTSWTLPPSLGTPSTLTQYQLTDTGRVLVGTVPVTNGAVSVTATAKTPYVLYPGPPPTLQTVVFGAEQRVKDPSFNSRSLAYWPANSSDGVAVTDDGNGLPYLRISSPAARSVRQKLATLAGPHTWSVSVRVRVTGTRVARLRVSGGGVDAEVYTDSSPLTDTLTTSRRYRTTFQRMKVLVTVPSGGARPTITLGADAATSASPSATVDFTDLRVVQNDGAGNYGSHYFAEDFEHVDQGWGPFVYTGNDGDHVHLSELHQGYTRDTISGQFSLKARADATGLIYRTLPQTLRLQPGRAYHVGFTHQSDAGADYRFVVGSDSSEASGDPGDPTGTSANAASTGYPVDDLLPRTVGALMESPPSPSGTFPSGWTDRLPPVSSAPSQTYDQTFSTGSDAHVWIGVARTGGLEFVLDNLVVDDLGPCSEALGALLTADVSPVVVTPGGTGSVTLTLTNASSTQLTNVRTTFTLPSGWTSSGSVAFPATLDPGAAPTATLTLTAPANALRDAAPVVRLSATATLGSIAITTTGATTATVPYPSFAAAANQASIVRDDHPYEGSFDNGFNSYSATALAAVGATPGAALTGAGAGLTMPQYGPGNYDNVYGTGATIALTGTGTHVSLLASGEAKVKGTVVVHYTDGTSTSTSVVVPAWTAGTSPTGGATAAVVTAYRVTQYGGPSPYDSKGPFCLYRVDVAYDTTKTLLAVTLPADPNLRTFGVAVT